MYFTLLPKGGLSTIEWGCESYLLVKASLCLEAAERTQWPKMYSLGRPRSSSHMPSLVGDCPLIHWALPRIRNLSLTPPIEILEMCIDFGGVKIVHFLRAMTNMSL